MIVIASNLLRDSHYGVTFRVGTGAALSTIDAATDIYVISTYYKSEALFGQANALLAMVCTNLFFQIIVVWMQYRKKSWGVKLKEVMVTLLFLRPAIDALKVATDYQDADATFSPLNEMVMNKCIELATESIPGCVLQLYVWLTNLEEAGTYALVSVGTSAMCTGFASAIISYDMDVDVPHRNSQPNFYG